MFSFIGHTLVRRILALQTSELMVPFAAFYSELRGGGNRQAVSRETLLHPTLYSLYRCWYRPGHSAEFRECRERPCNVIDCGNVRVTYCAYVCVCMCLHLYRSYIEIITMRHVWASHPSTLIRSVSRIAIQTRLIIEMRASKKDATVQIRFSFVTG